MIKAILFDFDGTIADTMHITLDSINEVRGRHGQAPVQYDPSMRDKTLQILAREHHISLLQVMQLALAVKPILKERTKKAKLFPGLASALTQLSKLYTIGIVTANMHESVQQVLTNHKVYSISFLYGESKIFGKQVRIQNALHEHQLSSHEVIYVGDEIRDIEACRKIGVKIVAVSWGFNSKRALLSAKPDALVDTPKALIAAIKKIAETS